MKDNKRRTVTRCRPLTNKIAPDAKWLKNTTENALVWIWEVDSKGRYIYSNSSVKKLLGYSGQEILKRHFYDVFHPKNREEQKKKAFQMFSQKKTFRGFLNRNIDKNGRTVWLSTSGVPVLDKKGKLLGYRGADTDVSKSKEAEEALQASEESVRVLVNTPTDTVILLDAKGTILVVNKVGAERFGRSVNELIGACVYDLFPPGLVKSRKQCVAQVIRSGKSVREEDERKGIIFCNTVYPVFNTQGKVDRVAIFAVDITRNKNTERALWESEKRYRNLFNNAQVGLFRSRISDGKFLECNDLLAKLIGYKNRDECLAKCYAAVRYTNPNVRRQMLKQISKYSEIKNFEAQVMRKDNSLFWVSYSARIYPEKGFIEGAVIEITERKRTEEELKHSFEKLQRIFKQTVQAMSEIIETRDPYTAGHQRRVAQLASAMAKEMGFSEEQRRGIHLAGILHDIGKIYIPSEILGKLGPLSRIELEIIRTHSQRGYDILKMIEFPWPIAKMVIQHHERIDGSGYPRGLSGENILLEARILGVADVVEAMVFKRPYREALGMNEALAEIVKNRNNLYDSQVVDTCVALITKEKFKLY